MAVELENSALMQELSLILAQPGSPYFLFQALLHSGGKDISPLQILRMDINRDYRRSSRDATSIVMTFGAGTIMNDIGPYQNDLKLTINISPADTAGSQKTAQPVLSRTYRAYLGDEIDQPSDTTHDPSLTDTETANRSAVKHITFILEEVAVEQLRKMTIGYIGRSSPPHAVMKALLVNACKALKLAADEQISGFDMAPANNQTPKAHVIIPDNTPVLEIPDMIQNDQGGIYSSGLGFYIQRDYIYTWPMYDMYRQDSARRILQIMLAPSRHSQMLDKTWRNNGRMISVYSAGMSKVIDDSLGQLNNGGNAVRFTMANQIVDGGPAVADNKMVASRSKKNSEFATAVTGNGQNVANTSSTAVTNNIYLEASKLASRQGAIITVPWRRSNPEMITPGMAAELLFDHNGTIRTIEGTVLATLNSYELEGTGPNAFRFLASTAITVFVDRNDPDYIAYMKAGGQISAVPEIESL